MTQTYSAAAVDITLKIINSYGLDAAPLMRELAIDPTVVQDANARFRYTQIDDLWLKAAERIKDPAMGLRAARFWHPSHLGALGYAWLSSLTLRTALGRFQRFMRLLTEGAELEFDERDGNFAVILKYHEISRQQPTRTDSFMAMLIAMMRCNLGEEFHPREVSFTHEAPADDGEFYALFRCPVIFKASANTMMLPLDALDMELSTANPQLALLSDQVMIDYLASMDKKDYVNKVKSEIIRQLPSGRLSDSSVAKALYMNVRTLQRRLQEDGTTFKTLLTEVRQELADTYIRDSSLSLNEISFLLGFSEISSFSRAYKRWAGQSPSVLRR